MRDLPAGTVTFFFSDIEGSTRLLAAMGDRYTELLDRHRQIFRDAFSQFAGKEVNTEGDSFFAAFGEARDAVAAAVAIQRGLTREAWPDGYVPRSRIGLHTGAARLIDDDYVGIEVHRAARIMAAANGGQVLISDATRTLALSGLEDDVEVRDLGERALRDLAGRERLFRVWAPGMDDDARAPRTLESAPNNLPVVASPLIGRERERAELRGLLATDSVRLLTLTGPGGIGKTRLGLQAAADQIDAFSDGVYFVDLAPSRDEEAALRTIAATIGAGVATDSDVKQALASQLSGRRVLLVLDNFEQVMAAADDIAGLLGLCPQLKVIVTSREALRVRGERLFAVQPLSLPDVEGGQVTADEALKFESVRLFTERAREVASDFVLADANARVVSEICVRLDGLPLAIELAAARLRIFSVDELRDRLSARFQVLRGGARDLPERQRTLRGTIEWSYELLGDDERRLFQVLSVFPSATLEAVETTAAAIQPLADADMVDALESLVDKSLLRRMPQAQGQGQRMVMLDTIREYATERLDEDPDLQAQARSAHSTFFASFADRRRPDLHSDRREQALADLGAELGNLQLAWAELVRKRDIGQLTQLFDPLWSVLEARGWYREVVALTNDLLVALGEMPPDPTRADEELALRMSLARGLLALRGYTREVAELYRQALELAESSGEGASRFAVLRSLASYHLYRAEIPESVAIGQRILGLAEQENDVAMQVEGHLIVGPGSAFMGDGAAGLGHLDRAIALYDSERDGRMQFRLGPNPGVVANAISGLLNWVFGYPEKADRRAFAARDLARRLGHPYSLTYALFHLTVLDLWNERLESVRVGAAEVLKVADEHEYRVWQALGHVLGGVAEAYLGDARAGVERVERGIALYEDLNTPPVFWPAVLALRARALHLAGRNQEAYEHVTHAVDLAGGARPTTISLYTQKADVEAVLGRASDAEATLWTAFDGAAECGALTEQLLAATRLVRLPAADQARDPRRLLRETYEKFSEGLDRPFLRDAAALIAEQ